MKSVRAESAGAAPPECALQLQPTIRPAVTPAELRAAAYLRASSFYNYPPGRSEWAARSHFRMKADTEWAAVTAKVEGTDEAYKHVTVTPFIACIPDDGSDAALKAAEGGLDASSKLPADSSSSGGDGSVGGAGATNGAARHAQLVVATCDLNRGRNLPAEELVGRWPQAAADGHDPSTQRAYLSNVCVASGVRRFGLARQLILAVEAAAAAAGVSHMYVHVVHDNTPAVKLYQQALGYEVETEESEKFARAASRPRRLLLCKRLVPV